MNLELLDFIQSHDNWEELLVQEPYCLKIQRKDNYILFKYNQLASDFSIKLVNETRGIIFYEPTWDVVCHPFDKFYNYGEPQAAKIDWNTAFVQEKVDGSLIKFWYHRGEWHISTNSLIDIRDASTGDAVYPTFYDILIKAVNVQELFRYLSTLKTYMFELVSPINRIVVPYKDFAVYFLESRDNLTGEESRYSLLFPQHLNVRYPKVYDIRSLEQAIRIAANMDYDEEGFVVCDANFNRIKVKSDAWFRAHYLMNNNVITSKRLLDVVLAGEIEEFLTYAPQYKEKIDSLMEKLIAVRVAAEFWENISNHLSALSDKEYAEWITSTAPPYIRPYLFSWRKGKVKDFNEYTANWDVNKWAKFLNL